MYSAFFIRYADEAIDDLKEIRSYYDEINPAITERFREELLRTEAGILANPFAYSRVPFKDFRRAVVKKFPYKVVYRTEKNIVYVFGIIHFSRSNKHIKTRLKK